METTNYITSSSLPENVKIIDNSKIVDESADDDLPIAGVNPMMHNTGNYNSIDFQNQKDLFEKEFITVSYTHLKIKLYVRAYDESTNYQN